MDLGPYLLQLQEWIEETASSFLGYVPVVFFVGLGIAGVVWGLFKLRSIFFASA